MQSHGHYELSQHDSQRNPQREDADVAGIFDFDVTKIFGHDNVIEPEVRAFGFSHPLICIHIHVVYSPGR